MTHSPHGHEQRRDIPSLGLTDLLPIHAEEGPAREECARVDLEARIARTASLTAGQAKIAVAIVERLFDAAGLLDRRALAAGDWAFVSYPAYLLGCSIAESLGQAGTRFVPEEYWEQGTHRPEAAREQQRAVLHFLEEGRRQCSAECANPIRRVWVAWGLVRIGGRFLLRHREDKTRPEGKNFVPPGGRLSLSDLAGTKGPRESLGAIRAKARTLFMQHYATP